MKSLSLALLAVALAGGNGVAVAAVVCPPLGNICVDYSDWYVTATLASGGTITGSFVYDQLGSGFVGYSDLQFNVVSSEFTNTGTSPYFVQLERLPTPGSIFLTNDGSAYLSLRWNSLADWSGSVGDSQPVFGAVGPYLQPNSPLSVDYIVSGTMTSVPEPATLWLLAIGLAGVGFMNRRTRRVTSTPS